MKTQFNKLVNFYKDKLDNDYYECNRSLYRSMISDEINKPKETRLAENYLSEDIRRSSGAPVYIIHRDRGRNDTWLKGWMEHNDNLISDQTKLLVDLPYKMVRCIKDKHTDIELLLDHRTIKYKGKEYWVYTPYNG